MGTTHGVSSTTPVSLHEAEQVARLMSALATASRVRILALLRQAPCSVGELTEAVEMAQPAVSHQLRILRDLGLVVGAREGRNTVYTLHDTHVATVLDEALRHIEHLRTGDSGQPVPPRGRPEQATPPGSETRWTAQVRQSREEPLMSEEHTHEGAHTHEHGHDDGLEHTHAHTEHSHEHVEHAHEHSHDGEDHSHPHVHQDDLQDVHEHTHA